MLLLDTLAELCEHARSVNADRLRRRALAIAQLADKARPPALAQKRALSSQQQVPLDALCHIYIAFAGWSCMRGPS